MAETGQNNEIAAYFKAKITDLIPNRPLEFNVFLFLKINKHIIIFKKKGDVLTLEFIDKCILKKMSEIWIHESEKILFQKYQMSSSANSNSSLDKTYEEKMIQLLSLPLPSDTHAEGVKPNPIDLKKKTALLAKYARMILQSASGQVDLQAQEKAHLASRSTVKNILTTISNATLNLSGNNSLLKELWAVAEHNPELTHSANVATYSVLFAFAMGQSNQELITDLALAGLLHDIGLSQIPLSAASQPWSSFTPDLQQAYCSHLTAGLEMINAFGSDVPERVKQFVQKHHQKFDGTGYPDASPDLSFDLPSQLLAMAEHIDSVASGQSDGIPKTYQETLIILEKIEKNKKFPEYFNPEIFDSIFKWTRQSSS